MSEAFLKIVNMSVSASWLVLVVLALRFLLKKAPKWVNVLLWGLVAIRLICPISIESSLSLIPDWQIGIHDIVDDYQPAANGQVLDSEGNVILEKELNTGTGATGQILDVDGDILVERPLDPVQVPTDAVPYSRIHILSSIWLAGILIMSGHTLLSYFLLKRKVSTSIPVQKGVRQSEYVDSPFVLGVIHPIIYLPYGIDEQSMTHVIAHEKAHIRRKDHWWKPLGFLLLTVHWFNPFMWAAYVLLCRDIELACDEKVIKELGNEQRADYSQALVACSVSRLRIAACPLAFGEVGVKERVKSIMNYRKPAFWLVVSALVVCAAVAVCFLTDPKPAPEFAMKGGNVSDMDPEGIVERIMDYQDIENSNVYMNANNFSLTVDGNFNWVDSQAVSYFYYEDHEVHSAQLRIFPDKQEYFLTESTKWLDQNRIFLLQHYLDAIKNLPQHAIRELAPADCYLIEHIDGGSPSDYDRVITYSPEGVGETDGWYLHLRILPHHANGDAYSGTGEEVVHLFYGESTGLSVKKWFDYSAEPELMDWNMDKDYTIEEFPGITFHCNPYEITVGERVLISGMPIWSTYLFDLTGDGKPEICTETSFGSGIIDNRIIVYDFEANIEYTLEDRGLYDYELRSDLGKSHLRVDKKVYPEGRVVYHGRLVIQDGSLMIKGAFVENPAIIDITDPTKVEGFSYDTALEKFFEDDVNEYYFSGVYSQYVTVHYEDGTTEGIVSALKNGRVIVSDLDRFNVRYHAGPKAMIPTETKLKGLGAGALLLPIDGHTYRYLLTDSTPEGVTADELLFSFQEIDMGENILNEIYSLKEYPDRSKVLLISAKNGPWLCEYSPPQRCSDTALADAIEAGYVVMEDGIATHGQEIWHEFYEQTQKGKEASVTVAHYHTLNPDQCDSVYYEIFKQDYPSLYVHQLSYDGKQFTLSNGAEKTRIYEYLMKYEDGPMYAFGSVVPQYRYQYVLTHDNRYTYNQLWMSIASSQAGAYIDHYTIYSEPKQ